MQTSPPVRTRTTLQALSEKGTIEIAIDTEFKDAHTLTIQAATRLSPRQVAVQVYRSSAIPPLPRDFQVADYLPTDPEKYGRFIAKAALRKTRKITPDLSPVLMLTDLFRLEGVEPVSRHDGQQRATQAQNATPRRNSSRLAVPAIRLVIIGHFLTADIGRMFGSDYYDDIFSSRPGGEQALTLANRKIVALAYAGSPFAGPPIVQYATDPDGNLFQVHLEFRDTQIAMGKDSLDSLSRTYLGMGKSEDITADDKADMLRTFHEKPDKAYGYAIRDVVNTLLVHEEMRVHHAAIYESFGVDKTKIPAMKALLGGRSSQFLVQMTARVSAGSTILAKERDLKDLMKKGGLSIFGGERAASRYGLQTGQIHGGLLYSRTPTRLWDQAPGMMADVDLVSCYARIISRMNVYWGRPVVHEPGDNRMTLHQAVDLLSGYCDPDAWYIRVSGNIKAGHNALIPSTRDAITEADYRKKRPKTEDRPGARLFSAEINSGIVTAATWAMIQAMPAELRKEYQQLSAESIVFYQRMKVAVDGVEYDRISGEVGLKPLPWSGSIDLENQVQTTKEPIDANYVSLKFEIGDLAQAMIDQRKKAEDCSEKKNGRALSWKLMANSLYGVLGSEHFPTGNAVAANVITATARAGAFSLVQSLNGYQVITDGCTYRRDQIPACTYAECLRLQPDYAIHRVEAGGPIPFLDPAEVPIDDAEFTAWYREHSRRFFGIEGETTNQPFAIHDLEHKKTAGRTTFDAIACMGAADYAKCNLRPDGSWNVEETKIRGMSDRSKIKINDWILSTLPNDYLENLPPVTEDIRLLKVGEAKARARQFLRKGAQRVALPLGHHDIRVRAYNAIRHSAFIFQDARQSKMLKRQIDKFTKKYRSGLEILALKRGYRGRPAGSLTAILSSIYDHVQAGKRGLTKTLNLSRATPVIKPASEERIAVIQGLQDDARKDLYGRIDATTLDPTTMVAAILCTDPTDSPLERSGSQLAGDDR
jgi:hypothetical protein